MCDEKNNSKGVSWNLTKKKVLPFFKKKKTRSNGRDIFWCSQFTLPEGFAEKTMLVEYVTNRSYLNDVHAPQKKKKKNGVHDHNIRISSIISN